MEEVNILQLMGQFDICKPISVTITVEENDEIPNCTLLQQQDQNQNFNHSCSLEKNITNYQQQEINNSNSQEKQHAQLTETQQIVITIEDEPVTNKQRVEMTNNHNSKRACKWSSRENNKKTINQNSTNKRIKRNTAKQSSKIYSPRALNIIRLLQEVSANLILVMRSFYHHSFRYPKQFNKVKLHNFKLSYNTVASIMLPQENNKIFVEKFIDMTVATANKVFGWKCENVHVKPFYEEMISWSKQEKKSNKKDKKGNKAINNNRKKCKSIDISTTECKDVERDDRGRKDVRCSSNESQSNTVPKITQIHNRKTRRSNESARINQNKTLFFKKSRKGLDKTPISHNTINTELLPKNRSNECQINNNVINNGIINSVLEYYKTYNKKTKENRISENEKNNNTSQVNNMLVQQLATPAQPVNFSHSTVAPIPSLNLNKENSTCLFSHGPPGDQITISISRDVLQSHTGQKTMLNNCPGTATTLHEPLPTSHQPSPTVPSQTQITSASTSQNITNIQNQMQNFFSQNIQLDHTLRHSTTNTVMQINQPQQQSTSTPARAGNSNTVTSNNISSRSKVTGPCLACGKITAIICSKCKRISYCSKQCLWLDTEARKARSQPPNQITQITIV